MVKFSSQKYIFSLFLSFLITCNIVVVICETKVSCNQKDKQILLCFKKGLIDPLGMLSNKEDCCEWRGVHCNNNGRRVTDISLPCYTDDDEFIIGRKTNKTQCLSGKIHLTLFELA
ncbi:unnamed protein product [Trifolium pratense]|uniref:Uncharacterized protein n=1 Tax=Trifolium pratense TaxID=57577 RepID=A0ACB0KJ50_TRIPR|nr:unnamed protein product [Trifolium pratense]